MKSWVKPGDGWPISAPAWFRNTVNGGTEKVQGFQERGDTGQKVQPSSGEEEKSCELLQFPSEGNAT